MQSLRVLLVLLALSLLQAAAAAEPTLAIRVGDAPLRVEVADEPHERQRGLMFRRSLPDGTGMLFVYPDEQRRGFWMKNTPLPLDIAFIDARGRVTEILPLEPYSERPVLSRWPARYALEVPRGWFAAQGVAAGARLTIEGAGR